MKMETVTQEKLLEHYLKSNYSGKNVLVIYQNDIEFYGEFDSLMNELSKVGLLPPKMFQAFGYLIIEMSKELATKLINQYSKSFIRMELYEDGICIHENL